MIWRSSYHSRIAQFADFSTALISFILSYYLSNIFHEVEPDYFPKSLALRMSIEIVVVILSIYYVFLFKQQKAYNYQRFTSLTRELKIILRVSFWGSLTSMLVIFLLGSKDISRTIFILFIFISTFLFAIQKVLLFHFAAFLRKKGKNRKRIILIGTGTRAKIFIEKVKINFSWGIDIIGALTGDEERIGTHLGGIKIIDHYKNITEVLKNINPEEVMITISTKRFDQIRDVLEICEREGVLVRLNSDFFGHITKDVTIDNMFGLSIISFNMTKLAEFELFAKRIIDIIGSLVAIILFIPFMILAAIGLWISDGRPILYEWNVIGLSKKPFRSWKFRTMVKNADMLKKDLLDKNEMSGPVFKIKDDPRIIPFGKILRKYSIDETPQLFSVLKGDMSLVGPRPAGPHELDRYESWQRRKLSIKPGITCLWQTNGRNKISGFDDWVRMDLEYIDNWSLLLDIKILLKTIPAVLFGKGAS